MDAFKNGTRTAATVLSIVWAIGIPAALAGEHGWPLALFVLAIGLLAIWGSRLGLLSIYRQVFERGREDERGQDQRRATDMPGQQLGIGIGQPAGQDHQPCDYQDCRNKIRKSHRPSRPPLPRRWVSCSASPPCLRP